VTFAFSTSSRYASVAVFGRNDELLWCNRLDAPQSASSACMKLLEQVREEKGLEVENASLFVADLGPGSFTGVRVGIVLAKTFGYVYGAACAGTDAFDLVAVDRTVVLPLKRGEIFIRRPGEAPTQSTELPDGDFLGYGPAELEPTYPDASRFGGLLCGLPRVAPEELIPRYLIEPSISISKRPIPGAQA